jgi:[glutamine synthetase] adenylyltransferase / [glutamine synthetase]-adenylyl-L-tyrosine phosphorylase
VQRYGTMADAEMAVLGFGKLGSREMTASSDLDLVIIYEAKEGAVSNGSRGIAASEYFARLTQRLVSTLSAQTPRGVAYDIDLRLRPSGNKGPVALSHDAFLAYQREEAETWEQMALTRARPIAGDHRLMAELHQELAALIARPRDWAKTRNDIAEMRVLIEKEKGTGGPLDLKTGRGGLLDLEFLAQAMTLRFAAEVPELAGKTTLQVLRWAASSGQLPAADGSLVSEAFGQFTGFLQLQAGLFGLITDETQTICGPLLARLMNAPDFVVFTRRIGELRSLVHALFEREMAHRV